MAQDARAAAKIKINKLLDISYNILYTWTAAGDGGGQRRACGRDPPVACSMWLVLVGGTHPKK